MNIMIYTFGCTVNNQESENLRNLFIGAGDHIIEDGVPDGIVINSCSVTSTAHNGSIDMLKRLRKKYPKAVIALAGCGVEYLSLTNRNPIEDADILVGNDKESVVRGIHELSGEAIGHSNASRIYGERAFVQMQTGCSCMCAYCVVPLLRGNVSISTPLDEIIGKIKSLARHGVTEIVLSGINLALYRDGGNTLIDVLLRANETPELQLMTLSSLEPSAFTDEFLNKIHLITRLAPHFHISLQSGCDKTLSRMGRQYSMAQYFRIIEKLREIDPCVRISTDVLVGFPGETDQDSLESMRNIARCRFGDIHIFKYSPRRGTVAETMPDQVTEHKKAVRAELLKGIKMQARYHYLESCVGREERVSTIRMTKTGSMEGLTSHNDSVLFTMSNISLKSGCRVRIDSVLPNGDGLSGTQI